MYVNHNLMTSNVARNLNAHYSRLATSTQRLSSGLRINGAADDAAGLAIRELQRADIAAFHQGARNANDAISMIQVADGALGIIDEKLIRMKELAEQAATGTYDSTQRLMIDSEFQAMAAEIDRIANATDFNGIKLLDGSLSGEHDGSGLKAIGKMKIHFGSGNDSAEDYYYVGIGDCTTKGLGLHDPILNEDIDTFIVYEGPINIPAGTSIKDNPHPPARLPEVRLTDSSPDKIDDLGLAQGTWYVTRDKIGENRSSEYYTFIIPKGTKNLLINLQGTVLQTGDNDIEVFTKSGCHLVGTPLDDKVFTEVNRINNVLNLLGFGIDDYDDSYLNTGPKAYDYCNTLAYSKYNGMTIGYSKFRLKLSIFSKNTNNFT